MTTAHFQGPPPGFERFGRYPGPPPGFDQKFGRCLGPPPGFEPFRYLQIKKLVSRTIDAYENLGTIGAGSYGTVYKARERSTGEICAVKEFKNSGGGIDSSASEIEFLVSCRHRSIVELKEVVLGTGRNPNSLYVVMEYIDQDLRSYIKSKSGMFREDEVRAIISDVLGAVYYLHCQGIMHRDIKPSNLLVTRSGKVKLCDFGLSRRFQDGKVVSLHRWCEVEKPDYYSTWVGTRGYIAPELLREERHSLYSPNIDVWSVGCVMAELLGKQPLFPCRKGSKGDQIDRIQQLVRSNQELYSEAGGCPLRDRFPAPLLSDEGYDLLARMLTIDPQWRISSQDAAWHDWLFKD